MSALQLSQINIYPIKSCSAISLTSASVDQFGLIGDRRFVIVDAKGMFITGRTYPQLTLINVKQTPMGLQVSAPNMPRLTINYSSFSNNYKKVQVWNDQINAQHCAKAYDQWFSQFLSTPCQLMYFGEQSQRLVENRDDSVAFADGYPLLLISQASLNDLNHRLQQQQLAPVNMSQFRTNLVIDNAIAYQEDSWRHIRIGEAEFEVVKPCSRCVFTTVDPSTGEKHSDMQPLKTLRQYRASRHKKGIMFGQNLITIKQGIIKLTDPVEVLSTQATETYEIL